MDQLITILKNSTLFSDLPEDCVKENILPLGQLLEYQKDQALILPQQQVDRFGLVLSGRVHILHLFADGSNSLMNVVSPGRFVGLDLISTKSRLSPYHAAAASPVQVFFLPGHAITHPGILPENIRLCCLERALTLIAHENIKKEYRLAILSQKGLRERIATYLTMQSARLRSNTVQIPFSRDEMASYLCVNRSALSHELSLMQQDGLISFRKNIFTLYDLGHVQEVTGQQPEDML